MYSLSFPQSPLFKNARSPFESSAFCPWDQALSFNQYSPRHEFGMLPSSPTITIPRPKRLSNDKNNSQRIFFKTLLTSIKQVTEFQNLFGNTKWKNPFLYKTNLCDHWRAQGNCRFGVNCWYAHGNHELRFDPRFTEIPNHEHISQRLSHLGLPPKVLDEMIVKAFQAAGYPPTTTYPEDPFQSNSNSMLLHHQQFGHGTFNCFKPQQPWPWSPTFSSSSHDQQQNSLNFSATKTFSLFDETFPSPFGLSSFRQ